MKGKPPPQVAHALFARGVRKQASVVASRPDALKRPLQRNGNENRQRAGAGPAPHRGQDCASRRQQRGGNGGGHGPRLLRRRRPRGHVHRCIAWPLGAAVLRCLALLLAPLLGVVRCRAARRRLRRGRRAAAGGGGSGVGVHLGPRLLDGPERPRAAQARRQQLCVEGDGCARPGVWDPCHEQSHFAWHTTVVCQRALPALLCAHLAGHRNPRPAAPRPPIPPNRTSSPSPSRTSRSRAAAASAGRNTTFARVTGSTSGDTRRYRWCSAAPAFRMYIAARRST